MEPRSNTMRMGAHRHQLAPSLKAADRVFLYQSEDLGWSLEEVSETLGPRACVSRDTDSLLALLKKELRFEDHVVFMSNGSFDRLPARTLEALEGRGGDE